MKYDSIRTKIYNYLYICILVSIANKISFNMKYLLHIIAVILCINLYTEYSFAVTGGDSIEFGVNSVELYRERPEDWRRSIDAMERHGVRLLRLTLRSNNGVVPQIVRYASSHGIRTLIVVPTGLPQFYQASAKRRLGTNIYWASYPLSEIDLDKFKSFWLAHLAEMKAAGATAFAYEIGNEINGPGFNGDFPVGAGAHESDAAACDLGARCAPIAKGFAKYVALLRLVRETEGLRPSLLTAAGLAAIGSGWAQSSHGYFFSARSTLKALRRLGVSAYVDAYAVHRYVNVGGAHGAAAERMAGRQLSEAVRDCAAASGKPCWLTEWGVRAKSVGCADDPERDALLAASIQALRTTAAPYAFYFDWDQNPTLSLYRCGHLVSPAAASMWKAPQ